MMLPALGVFGISGVGKTTIIRQYINLHPEIVTISGGRLLQQIKGKTGEELRQNAGNNIQDSQAGLIDAFQAFRNSSTSLGIIFDGHTIIDTDKGVAEIPLHVIAGLKLSSIIFVSDDPAAIALRRESDTNRQRPNRDFDTLAAHQVRARHLAQTYAIATKIPFHEVSVGKFDNFQRAADLLFFD